MYQCHRQGTLARTRAHTHTPPILTPSQARDPPLALTLPYREWAHPSDLPPYLPPGQGMRAHTHTSVLTPTSLPPHTHNTHPTGSLWGSGTIPLLSHPGTAQATPPHSTGGFAERAWQPDSPGPTSLLAAASLLRASPVAAVRCPGSQDPSQTEDSQTFVISSWWGSRLWSRVLLLMLPLPSFHSV